eukprot:gene17060-biopygen1678
MWIGWKETRADECGLGEGDTCRRMWIGWKQTRANEWGRRHARTPCTEGARCKVPAGISRACNRNLTFHTAGEAHHGHHHCRPLLLAPHDCWCRRAGSCRRRGGVHRLPPLRDDGRAAEVRCGAGRGDGSINAASEDTAAATMYGFSDEVPLLGARSGGAARAAAGRASGDLPAPTAGADREPASGDTSADVPFATQSSAQRSRCTLRDHRDATPASGIGAVSVAQQGVRRDAHEARS